MFYSLTFSLKRFFFAITASLVMVAAVATPTPTHAASYTETTVRIETVHGTMLHDTVYVSDAGCTVTDLAGGSHALEGDNAICALDAVSKQQGIEYTLSYFDGFGLLLNSIGAYTSGANYWLYYVNYQEASVGMADYDLQNGDELLLTFGGYALPLRLQVNDTHIVQGEEVAVTVDWYSYDWGTGTGSYVPATRATVVVGGYKAETDENGVARFTASATGTISAYAIGNGFTKTPVEKITVYPKKQKVHSVPKTTTQKQIDKGVDFLQGRIDENGLVDGSQAITEWTAVALASVGVKNDALTASVRKYRPKPAQGTTEIARHILAAEALGMNARNKNGVHYVARLEKTMQNDQFGSELYCNDDIFAGLALIAADASLENSKVRRAMHYAMNCVNEDGGVSFAVDGTSDVDTTAAWVMLVSKMIHHKDYKEIVTKEQHDAAVAFLRRAQNPNGGWGYAPGSASNTSSTAWALMALSSRGHEASAMHNNKQNGFSYLNKTQKSDGSFKYDKKDTESNETLNTAYATTALSKKAYPVNKKIEKKTGKKKKETAQKKESTKKSGAEKSTAKK